MDDDIPYLLLTPGPLTTSRTVREAMMRDYCTWDDDYNSLVNEIRSRLVGLASDEEAAYTAVLMQGSGTFAVEATVGSVLPPAGRLLVLVNGAYGRRIAEIAARLQIDHVIIEQSETEPTDPAAVAEMLQRDAAITHVAMVHCETTTGMLNPVAAVGERVKAAGKTFIVDAMSSFGGLPMTMESVHADYLIASANKCIQGTPGFGFIIADRQKITETSGWARSLSLDLHGQWDEMEQKGGKWRFTSPTHIVRAFQQALDELDQEGGVTARSQRYQSNQNLLVKGMRQIGFRTLLEDNLQSPIITAFHYPEDEKFSFIKFYEALKERRFVIYPGKVTGAETFRIGNIGHVFSEDIEQLLLAVQAVTADVPW